MRRLVAVVLAAVFAVALTGPADASVAPATPGRLDPISCYQSTKGHARSADGSFAWTGVWLYGDSITYQNRLALYPHLGRVSADAYWGRATAPTVQALGSDVHRTRRYPSVVIMAIGTNDLANPAGMEQQVRLARAVIPQSTRLLWVNTYTDTVDEATMAAINDAIASVPGVQVVDWHYYNEAWSAGAETSPLLSDGVHLSCLGQYVWVNMIHRALVTPAA